MIIQPYIGNSNLLIQVQIFLVASIFYGTLVTVIFLLRINF